MHMYHIMIKSHGSYIQMKWTIETNDKRSVEPDSFEPQIVDSNKSHFE